MTKHELLYKYAKEAYQYEIDRHRSLSAKATTLFLPTMGLAGASAWLNITFFDDSSIWMQVANHLSIAMPVIAVMMILFLISARTIKISPLDTSAVNFFTQDDINVKEAITGVVDNYKEATDYNKIQNDGAVISLFVWRVCLMTSVLLNLLVMFKAI